MTAEELFFFHDHESLIPIYGQLRDYLIQLVPGASIRVTKTQISFCERYIFAVVSLLPIRGLRAPHITVSLSFPTQKNDACIAAAVQVSPNRWTHHIPVTEALSCEIKDLLEEAILFAQRK